MDQSASSLEPLILFVIMIGVFMGIFFMFWLRQRHNDRRAALAAGPSPKKGKTPPPAAPAARGPELIRDLPMAPVQTAPASEVMPFAKAYTMLLRGLHILIVGETNTGKSTWANALMGGAARLGGQVVIIDPHAKPTSWGGLPAIGKGRDYAAVGVALDALLNEMVRRFAIAAEDATYQPRELLIFVDEWPSIKLHCGKIAPAFMTQIAQEGRKVGMRLVVLTQSDRVESLGLGGMGDVRGNFMAVLLGAKAIEKISELEHAPFPVALRASYTTGTPQAVDPTGLLDYQHIDVPVSALWYPANSDPFAVEETGEHDDLFRALVDGLDVPENRPVEREQVRNNQPEQGAGTADDETTEQAAADIVLLVRTLVDAGWSGNQIRKNPAIQIRHQVVYQIINEYKAEKEATAAAKESA